MQMTIGRINMEDLLKLGQYNQENKQSSKR